MPTGIFKRSKEHNYAIKKALTGRKLSEETKRKISKSHKGKKISKSHRAKISDTLKGTRLNKENPAWKGASACIDVVHSWVVVRKGKAKGYKCKCGKQAHDWSNKKHDYRRNLDDYVAMCRSCHEKYDFRYNNKQKR